MDKRILILGDGSEAIGALVQKLSQSGFSVQVCRSAAEASSEAESKEADLLIAAGNYPEMMEMSQKVYELSEMPSFLVLDSAGDQTQASLRRHPGVIGVFFSPLNVEKLHQRIIQLFGA